MNLRIVPIALALIAVLAGCERSPSSDPARLEAERRREEQIQALDEKIAQLQDLERQANERKLAEIERKASESEKRASVSEQERQRLEKERQALLRERERLADAQKKAQQETSEAERRAAEIERRAGEERQARTIDLFYTALDPHGEWLEVEPYGYVWHPNTASNPRWRPYTDGRWVFTEYGWTWKSNEPFGWAAYHYGRWTRIKRIGWIWVPGTEWGPGWVSWRRGNQFVGWAPLPPEAWSGSGFNEAVDSYYEIGPSSYTFVPVEEIGEPSYVGRVVEPERNVTIVNQTVNVTNIKYTNIQNTTVVYNGGPDLSEVNARSQQKVPRLDVERVTEVRNPSELGRAEQKGNKLVIAAPQIVRTKESKRPVRVREQVKAPELERGWTDIDRQSADAARAQITKEARQTEERQRKSAPVREKPAVATPPPAATTPQPTATPRKTVAPAATPEPAPTPAPPRRRGEDSGARPGRSPEQAPAVGTGDSRESREPARGRDRGSREESTQPSPATSATPAPATPTPSSSGRSREQMPQARPATPAGTPVATPARATPKQAAETEAAAEQKPADVPVTPRRQRPVGDATTPAATPQPSTPTGDAIQPVAEDSAAPASDRRPPKAKRPRPASAPTPPAASPIPAEVPATPAATPEGERKGKRRQRQDATAEQRDKVRPLPSGEASESR